MKYYLGKQALTKLIENIKGLIATKQDKLTGAAGQVVSFDDNGSAIAVPPPQGCNENLLINWDFRNPVNRNGKTAYTTSGRTIDRWMGKCSIMSGFLRIDGYIYQVLSNTPLNVSLTFSAMLNDGSLVYGTTSLSDLTSQIYFYVDSQIQLVRAPNAGFMLWTASTVDVISCKLELGSEQTLARKNDAGKWEIIEPTNYDLQYVLSSLYSPYNGSWTGYTYSNENLLDNWYFADPINQRGQTEYTASTYGIDRWRSDGVVTVGDGYITSIGANIYQLIPEEEVKSLLGKQLTLSALYSDGTLDFGTVNMPNAFPATTTGYAAASNLNIAILGNHSAQIFRLYTNKKIVAVKTELGPVQTLAHREGSVWVLNDPPPNKAQELLKCQRYQVYGPLYGTKVWTYNTSSRIGIFFPLPVTMRATPTLIGTLRYSKDGSTGFNPVSSKNLVLEKNGVYMYIDQTDIDFSTVTAFYLDTESGFTANL